MSSGRLLPADSARSDVCSITNSRATASVLPISKDNTSSASHSFRKYLSAFCVERRRVILCTSLIVLVLGFLLYGLYSINHHDEKCRPYQKSAEKSIKLVLVRHAQSENNKHWYRTLFFAKRDPMITKEGWTQSLNAHNALEHDGIAADMVMSSRLMRAMETASLVFGGTVLVAPHISELGAGCLLSPGSCPLSIENQRAALAGAGFNISQNFDWSRLDEKEDALTPSWPKFVSWLWSLPEVRRLVHARGENTTIAIVSHGNFLQFNAIGCGWGHPHNTEAYSARLAVPEPNATPLSGLRDVSVLYGGSPKDLRR